MPTEAEEIFNSVRDRLLAVKRDAKKENLEPVFIVFLPDGTRFRVRGFNFQEPHFFILTGSEEHIKSRSLLMVPCWNIQCLFELREPQEDQPRQKPGFIEADDLIPVDNQP